LGSVMRLKAFGWPKLSGWCPPVSLLFVENNFPIPPLHCFKAIGYKHREALTDSTSRTSRRRNSVWSTPSIARFLGTAAPAIFANVVKVSTSCTISLLTRPAGIRLGHRIMNGARREPSMCVK
jgi:hypothetical protein